MVRRFLYTEETRVRFPVRDYGGGELGAEVDGGYIEELKKQCRLRRLSIPSFTPSRASNRVSSSTCLVPALSHRLMVRRFLYTEETRVRFPVRDEGEPCVGIEGLTYPRPEGRMSNIGGRNV